MSKIISKVSRESILKELNDSETKIPKYCIYCGNDTRIDIKALNQTWLVYAKCARNKGLWERIVDAWKMEETLHTNSLITSILIKNFDPYTGEPL